LPTAWIGVPNRKKEGAGPKRTVTHREKQEEFPNSDLRESPVEAIGITAKLLGFLFYFLRNMSVGDPQGIEISI
jgi:hypothetical protein